jgi:hypothetical protein
LCDGDFWNGVIEDLVPQLKAWQINKNLL